MPDSSFSRAGFDRVAWCYDALAGLVFGRAQRRAQQAALAGLPAGAPYVLVLGGGTGWVLGEIFRRCPQARVLYLEASPAMLARAARYLQRHWLARQHQVEFRHGTQAALRPADRFDAVVTFFVLDCLPAGELAEALQQLQAVRRRGAPWLLADFRPAQRWWQHLLLWAMYCFFRFSTGLEARQLPDFWAELTKLKLRARGTHPFFGGAIGVTCFVDDHLEKVH